MTPKEMRKGAMAVLNDAKKAEARGETILASITVASMSVLAVGAEICERQDKMIERLDKLIAQGEGKTPRRGPSGYDLSRSHRFKEQK